MRPKPTPPPPPLRSAPSQPEPQLTEKSEPKQYKPLVKHFNPNDPNYGFDLARVKMEPGTANTNISSFKSFIQRRSSPSPSHPPPSSQSDEQSEQHHEHEHQNTEATANNLEQRSTDCSEDVRTQEKQAETVEKSMPATDDTANGESINMCDDKIPEAEGTQEDLSEGNEHVGEIAKEKESSIAMEGSGATEESVKAAEAAETTSGENNVGLEKGEGEVEDLPEENLTGAVEAPEDDLDGAEEMMEKEGLMEEEDLEEVEEYLEEEEGDMVDEGEPVGDDDVTVIPADTACEGGNETTVSSKSSSSLKKTSSETTSLQPASSSTGPSVVVCRKRRHPSSSFSSDSDRTANEQQQRELYKQQLAYYRTPIVGGETVCIFCLLRCADKEPQLLNCLHSACKVCFQVRAVFCEQGRPVFACTCLQEYLNTR